MGNCLSITLQTNATDSLISQFCTCTGNQAKYACDLEDNLKALLKALEELTDERNDLLRRVNIAEQQHHLKRLDKVQRWISRVEALEAEVNELNLKSTQEINKLCLWGCCSKNYISTYKFGKNVFEKLAEVTDLKSKGEFEVVADREPAASVVEMPLEPTVGLETLSDKVWKDLNDGNVGRVGLYGKGGVGKTTLLKNINNNFLKTPNNYHVIWVVVSKDCGIEKMQNDIWEKIGFVDEAWKRKNCHQKAIDIFGILNKRKFVLLLDDIWERVDLSQLGVPLPDRRNGSKLVFTTRSKKVCFGMEADEKIEVRCLSWEKSWTLFREKVGEEALNSHPEIPCLAETVAKECGGLPLALVVIGRAMACKTTPQEWRYAIQVLKDSASEFSDMEDEVLARLKFSYDNLSSEEVRSCFLYCALFPEDWKINRNALIDYWICEGLLDEFADIGHAKNRGCDIISSLLYACLLEDSGVNHVRMHDIVRDMGLWIACKCGNEIDRFLVKANSLLSQPPRVEKWSEVKRISLMRNQIENLPDSPTCPILSTLFLGWNDLKYIADSFFESMPKLRVLDLSHNRNLTYLPVGISKLVSLQYLNLSGTEIKELPRSLKNLVMLKHLNLRLVFSLDTIPEELVLSFSQLQSFDTVNCGLSEMIVEDSVQCGGNELLVRELECLEHLISLRLSLKCVSALERILTSKKFQNSTKELWLRYLSTVRFLDMSRFANMKHLDKLTLESCSSLEELKMDWNCESGHHQSRLRSHLQHSVMTGDQRCFLSLHEVRILSCHKIKDLHCLVFAPHLCFLFVSNCIELEEIICLNKLGEASEEPFLQLANVWLINVPRLKSIYPKPLALPCLERIGVSKCGHLKKLPISSSITKIPKLLIEGEEYWWNELEWEDKATRDAFLPCFQVRHHANIPINSLSLSPKRKERYEHWIARRNIRL